MIELLTGLHQAGSTICLVTHDPRWRSTTQRTVQLLDGTIVGETTAAEAEDRG